MLIYRVKCECAYVRRDRMRLSQQVDDDGGRALSLWNRYMGFEIKRRVATNTSNSAALLRAITTAQST